MKIAEALLEHKYRIIKWRERVVVMMAEQYSKEDINDEEWGFRSSEVVFGMAGIEIDKSQNYFTRKSDKNHTLYSNFCFAMNQNDAGQCKWSACRICEEVCANRNFMSIQHKFRVRANVQLSRRSGPQRNDVKSIVSVGGTI